MLKQCVLLAPHNTFHMRDPKPSLRRCGQHPRYSPTRCWAGRLRGRHRARLLDAAAPGAELRGLGQQAKVWWGSLLVEVQVVDAAGAQHLLLQLLPHVALQHKSGVHDHAVQ